MEWISWICLMCLIFYSSYPKKVKRLEKEVAKLKKAQGGNVEMSRLIEELKGKKCKLTDEDGIQNAWIYTVLDVDDEWVKVEYNDKKGNKIEIIRIENIGKVDLISE